jgi:hypothetical protein
MKTRLAKKGDVELSAPHSLATCMQFTALWAGDLDRARLSQLCAGAIGVCCGSMPRYIPSNSAPLDYGYQCLEELLQAGCTPTVIYQVGSDCLALMAAKIPSEDEVTEAENFSKPDQDSLNG